MNYNEIGKTGMRVSNLSFGASSLGGVFHDIREAEGIKAVYTAVENGMNFIDVSPYYGHYKAETVLGKALKEIPRDKYYLSTKVGRYGKDGINTWDYSGKRATESVYESLERLHIEYIDLINVHDVEFSDMNQVVNETLPALVELKKKGIVGHVGITDLQLENLKWVIDHSEPGTVESVLNFCHYCLNDEKLTDYLDYFESKNIGLFIDSVLLFLIRTLLCRFGFTFFDCLRNFGINCFCFCPLSNENTDSSSCCEPCHKCDPCESNRNLLQHFKLALLIPVFPRQCFIIYPHNFFLFLLIFL